MVRRPTPDWNGLVSQCGGRYMDGAVFQDNLYKLQSAEAVTGRQLEVRAVLLVASYGLHRAGSTSNRPGIDAGEWQRRHLDGVDGYLQRETGIGCGDLRPQAIRCVGGLRCHGGFGCFRPPAPEAALVAAGADVVGNQQGVPPSGAVLQLRPLTDSQMETVWGLVMGGLEARAGPNLALLIAVTALGQTWRVEAQAVHPLAFVDCGWTTGSMTQGPMYMHPSLLPHEVPDVYRGEDYGKPSPLQSSALFALFSTYLRARIALICGYLRQQSAAAAQPLRTLWGEPVACNPSCLPTGDEWEPYVTGLSRISLPTDDATQALCIMSSVSGALRRQVESIEQVKSVRVQMKSAEAGRKVDWQKRMEAEVPFITGLGVLARGQARVESPEHTISHICDISDDDDNGGWANAAAPLLQFMGYDVHSPVSAGMRYTPAFPAAMRERVQELTVQLTVSARQHFHSLLAWESTDEWLAETTIKFLWQRFGHLVDCRVGQLPEDGDEAGVELYGANTAGFFVELQGRVASGMNTTGSISFESQVVMVAAVEAVSSVCLELRLHQTRCAWMLDPLSRNALLGAAGEAQFASFRGGWERYKQQFLGFVSAAPQLKQELCSELRLDESDVAAWEYGEPCGIGAEVWEGAAGRQWESWEGVRWIAGKEGFECRHRKGWSVVQSQWHQYRRSVVKPMLCGTAEVEEYCLQVPGSRRDGV